ncbi:hypothetical protein PENSUB_9824 [Penicillium subrubescens]|uniref:Uncharacterized protein n=1 Tax=Penicillium subrubescens TaxID=1316194 RepID=A0A1Q5TCE9_9EURO|nr:hypothetical protein PENSUB_9824 [Penicillium subrubescens]
MVILETKIFYIDKGTVKQPSYPDDFVEVKWASTSGPIGCVASDQKSSQSINPFVGDWIHTPGANTSLTSVTYFGSVTSQQGENCQDHSQSFSSSGQRTIPFHGKHSHWEPDLLGASLSMGNTDCISQFTYWAEGANAITQSEQYKTANHVSASKPAEHTSTGIGRLPQSNTMHQNWMDVDRYAGA